MENAEIIIYWENKTENLPVQFNPSEYSISQSARFSTDEGIGSADTSGDSSKKTSSFLAEECSTFKFKLTLDGFTSAKTTDDTKANDISSEVDALRSLTRLDEKLHRPPLCAFHWGAMFFPGYVDSLNIQYTMFSPEGKPVRATADISIKSALDQKVAYQSPDRTKRRVLSQGTPLYMLAQEVYGDSAAWRQIAIANDIKNPRKLMPGIVLKIPPLEKEAL